VQWIALTVGVCLLSSLIPVVNAEIYIVALVTAQPQVPWWLVGLAAAFGQMIGKVFFYYAGRGVLRLPKRLSRISEWERRGRWAQRLQRFQDTCRDRPFWSAGVLLVSASLGLPPFAALAVVAGIARVDARIFVATGFTGRFIRFGAIAAFPGLIHAWWF
jgi:membrane protein YqaA with SNARE-associated domain